MPVKIYLVLVILIEFKHLTLFLLIPNNLEAFFNIKVPSASF